jgi:hypothetical protein
VNQAKVHDTLEDMKGKGVIEEFRQPLVIACIGRKTAAFASA